MIIDFSKVNGRERPTLILRTMSGTAIQTLGYAFNISLEANYNEVSTLSFDIPAYVDGNRVPGYEKIVGMQIVEMVGVGQFLINNPGVTESATKEIKSVKAYSLEYEFTFKKLTLENSTYGLWNYAYPENTIMSIILEKMPSWSMGEIDSTLLGKYRTYEVSGQNLYDIMKGTLQDSYGCIFDFDTLNRRINVWDANLDSATRPIYISLENLAKEISIEEQTENIFTCLDVNGAEGVNIRSVNPTGTNVLYDLGYFMNGDNFTPELVDKWKAWVQGVEDRRQEYFNRTIENALLYMKITSENAHLGTLQGELKVLEAQQSVHIEAAAQGIPVDVELEDLKAAIDAKNAEIDTQKAHIADLNDELASNKNNLVEINNACKWHAYGITPEEEILLNRYIKEDSIEDSSFVLPTVENYIEDAGDNFRNAHVIAKITADTTSTTLSSGKKIYTAKGGFATVTVNGENKMSGALVRCSLDPSARSACLYFEKGCVTISGGAGFRVIGTFKPAEHLGPNVELANSVDVASVGVDVYITTQLTEYSKRSVEWELYEYGREVLHRCAYPSYAFSIDSGNFLAMEDFDAFRKQLTLGDKLYLNLGDTFGVLTPILVGATIGFDDRTLSLEFSSSFSSSDNAFKLADLLDQSVSMGKSVDLNKYNYNAFTNAGGASGVRNLMNTMTDLALTQIKSSGNQAWTLDDAGLRLRKWTDITHSAYEDSQVWMTNNQIVFTNDGWNSATMALGTFTDKNTKGKDGKGTMYGIVAPNIVGTLFAGENLVIESEKKDGDVSVFKVDAEGAKLYNSTFDLLSAYTVTNDDGTSETKKYGQISLHPSIGIVAGAVDQENGFFYYDKKGAIIGIKTREDANRYVVTADRPSKNKWTYTPNANFWIDMKGNVFMRGTIYAEDGIFNGTVYATNGKFTGEIEATSGKFTGTISASTLEGKLIGGTDGAIIGPELGIGGTAVSSKNASAGNFYVDSNGNVTMKGSISLEGSVSWSTSSSPTKVLYAVNKLDRPTNAYSTYVTSSDEAWHTELSDDDYYASYSYAGGNAGTWTSAILIRGKDGEPGEPGENAELTHANIVEALVDGTTGIGMTKTQVDGSYVYSPVMYGGTIYGAEFHGSEYVAWCDPEKYGEYEPAFTIKCKLDEGWFTGFQIKYMDSGTTPYVTMGDAGAGAHMTINYPYIDFDDQRCRVRLNTAYAVSMPYGTTAPSADDGKINGQVYFQIID